MFHLSLPCNNVEETKTFYLSLPGIKLGRQQPTWIDVDLFENQVTFVEIPSDMQYPTYRFEDTSIPAFHFGVILSQEEWNKFKEELSRSRTIEVATFLAGKKGEHTSFFLTDPNGYTIEFKCFSSQGDEFKE